MSQNGPRQTCGVETADGTTCGNPATAPDGTCHLEAHTRDASADGGASESSEMSLESACGAFADVFGDEIARYKDAADSVSDDLDAPSVVAFATIRKVGANDREGYVKAFGECAVGDCDRAAHGFTAETCDQHDASDVGDASESGGGSVSFTKDDIKDMSPEQIKALPPEAFK